MSFGVDILEAAAVGAAGEILDSRRKVFIQGRGENAAFRLVLDASISESHKRTSDITNHPVEQGADITDHMRALPDEVDITGIVSKTPIQFLASLTATASVPGGSSFSRAEDAFRALDEARKAGATFDIFTTLASYTSMALVSLTTPRDASRGNVAELQMTFREIRFAETEKLSLPDPVDARHAVEVNLGKAARAVAEAKDAVAATSAFANIAEALGAHL